MKRLLLFVAVLGVLTLSSRSLTSPVNSAAPGAFEKKERATAKFYEPVNVLGVTLRGEYLFIHDDEAMARGEACTYIYKGVEEAPSKLVVSFHCTPALRVKVDYFTVRTVLAAPGEYQLTEYQFAGSNEAHTVPLLAQPRHDHRPLGR